MDWADNKSIEHMHHRGHQQHHKNRQRREENWNCFLPFILKRQDNVSIMPPAPKVRQDAAYVMEIYQRRGLEIRMYLFLLPLNAVIGLMAGAKKTYIDGWAAGVYAAHIEKQMLKSSMSLSDGLEDELQE